MFYRSNLAIKSTLVLLFTFSYPVYSQVHQYETPNLFYLDTEIFNYTTEFHELEDLPKSFQIKIHDQLSNQLGTNYHQIKFLKGYQIDLFKYFKDYPNNLNQFESIQPKFIFHYIYSDTSLGIKKYEFRMGCDQFAQFIYLNFPHGYNYKAYDILCVDRALDIADSTIKKEKIEYSSQDYSIDYNPINNELVWNIIYDNDKQNADENYSTIIKISASTGEVMEIEKLTSVITIPETEYEEETILFNTGKE